MWQKIGVDVAFNGLTRNMMLPRVFTDWDFDATLQAYSTAGDPAPQGVVRLYVTSAIRRGTAAVNASGYSSPEVDQLFTTKVAEAAAVMKRGLRALQSRSERIAAKDLNPCSRSGRPALLGILASF